MNSSQAAAQKEHYCCRFVSTSRSHRKHRLRCRISSQHEGVITGRDGFSLRSFIADPQGVAT
ncbi:hypothetical protein [Lysinibacillus sp. CTST325]